MPAHDTRKESEEDGKSRPNHREVLVNPQKPETHRRDAELHDHEESASPLDQVAHEGVEFQPTMTEVGEGQESIQRLEEKDREENQPQGTAQAVHVDGRGVRGAPTAPTPPS